MSRRIAAAVMTALLLCLTLGVTPASAHSFTRDMRPAADGVVRHAPKRVVIWFNEPVEAEFATIAVVTRKGRSLTVGAPFHVGKASDALAVKLRRDAPRGRYRVQWRVVSADSHIQQGAFAFTVKAGASGRERGGRGAQGAMAGMSKAEMAAMGQGATAGMGKGGAKNGAMGKGGGGKARANAAPPPVPAASSSTTVLLGVARGLTMTGTLLLVGVLAFWLLAWRGLRASVAPRSEAVETAFLRRAGRLTTVALTLTITATVAWVALQGAAAVNQPVLKSLRFDVFDRVLLTGFGKAAVARIVLLELLVITAVLLRLLPGRSAVPTTRAVGAAALQPAVSGLRAGALVAVIVPLLLTLSLVSHAVSETPAVLHVTADVVHLAAAGAWIGGLVVLLTAAFPVARALSAPERVALLGPVVVRFSRIAAVSVLLVVVTGAVRGWAAVGSVEGLTTSPYGRVLLLKLAVFSVLLALGAVNHFWAIRRISSAAAAGADTAAVRILRRTVGVETTLATVIVVATAVLVSLPAPTM